MAATIPQVEAPSKLTPVIGRPWPFKNLPESYLIPRTIAADRTLPPAAKLLWGIIRQYSFRDNTCCASDETLAGAIALSDRQFRRHIRALEKAGLVKSAARAGKTTVRELVWDSRFVGKKPVGRTDVSGGVDTNVRGVRTDVSGPLKEEGVSKGLFKGDAANGLKKPSEKPAAPPAQKPAAEWTEEDYIRRGRAMGFPEHVIARDVERVRARRAGEGKFASKDPAGVDAVIAAITGR